MLMNTPSGMFLLMLVLRVILNWYTSSRHASEMGPVMQ